MSETNGGKISASLRTSAIDTLVTSQGGPGVKSESMSPQYADKVDQIGRGRAREMAQSYLDGSIDDASREAFLAPWGGTKSVTREEADAVADSVLLSPDYADDLWSSALDASRRSDEKAPSA